MSESSHVGSNNPLILIPVHNDWEAVGLLLSQLDAELASHSITASVLLVDDGSTTPAPSGWCESPFQAIRPLEVLELRCNLGHQRALAVGLAYAEANTSNSAVVVMDGDGEDDPRIVSDSSNDSRRRVKGQSYSRSGRGGPKACYSSGVMPLTEDFIGFSPDTACGLGISA